jgi:DDE superfamily endonuclease
LCFTKYQHHLRPRNKDTSGYGLQMLKGYLLLDSERNYANIDRKLNGDHHKDGQNLQHYMSDSPWESEPVFRDVQQDIRAMPFLQGGTLNFDETADECAGTKKAGASRQYLGREGKTDLGQVVVLGSYYKDGHWLLTDAELFLPEEWFDPVHKKQWGRLHIPPGRAFRTKVEMARQQFVRAVGQGLPFTTVGYDSLYGRDVAFRRLAVEHGKHYMACVPSDSQVWLEDPAEDPNAERALAKGLLPRLTFEAIETRQGERGALTHEYAFLKVWTQQKLPKSKDAPLGYVFHPETLVVRKEHDGKTSFAFSDYQPDEKLPMARSRAERYFVERTIQDCKSELGFDELQALKYRALMHTLALCSVALLYMAGLKMKLRQNQCTIEKAQVQFPDVQKLPDLSLSNVKELLKATFPLPTLNKKQAVNLVIEHLFRRTRSTQSRQKKNSS